jgi:hypothetical protein
VLGRDVLVLHAFGVAFGRLEYIRSGPRQAYVQVCAADLRTLVQVALQFLAQSLRRAGNLGHDGGNDALVLLEQSQQQVCRFDGLMTVILGQLLSRKNSFLGFLGIFIEVHGILPYE